MPENPLAADLDHVLEHTRELWAELRGERIFITGGTGFFGCWLLESFTWANDRLGLKASTVVLTRNPDAFRQKVPHLAAHPALQIHLGDVRNFAFPSGSFSHIIHAATESSAKLNREDPLLMLDTILEGTRHTLDLAHSCGAKKMLLTSSGAVYGKQPPDLPHLPEDYLGGPDPLDPLCAYAEGKRAAEAMCTLYAKQSGLEMKIARGFAFVGPYLPLDVHFAIGNFIRDGLNGGPLIVRGDGTPQRSYLYTADLAIWLWTILFHGQSGQPYNVGSERSVTIRALAEIVAQAFQPKPLIRILTKAEPDKPIEQYVPSTKKAFNELKLTQIIGLEEAIVRTISWARPE